MGPKGEITVEQVLTSRMMAEPLHLLDCCIVNQGGGCVVVTRRDDVGRGGTSCARGAARMGRGPRVPRSERGPEPHVVLGPGRGRRRVPPCGRRAATTSTSPASPTTSPSASSSSWRTRGSAPRGKAGRSSTTEPWRSAAACPRTPTAGTCRAPTPPAAALFTLIELVEQLRGGAGDPTGRRGRARVRVQRRRGVPGALRRGAGEGVMA